MSGRKRRSETEIVAVLQRVDQGAKVADICREMGVSEATYHRWRAKYGGMTVNELKRVREIETENGQLKRIIADQALQIHAMKEVLKKNW